MFDTFHGPKERKSDALLAMSDAWFNVLEKERGGDMERRRWGNEDPKKLIIFGFSHCGTSILKSVIGHIQGVLEAVDKTDKVAYACSVCAACVSVYCLPVARVT